MRHLVIKAINTNKLVRYIVGYIVMFTLLSLVYLSIIFLTPGKYLVHFYSSTAQPAQIGEPVRMDVCRNTYLGPTRVDGARTFYVDDITNPVKEVVITFDVEDSGCKKLQIPVSQQPQEPGTYWAVVTVRYKALGFIPKHTSYAVTYQYGEL